MGVVVVDDLLDGHRLVDRPAEDVGQGVLARQRPVFGQARGFLPQQADQVLGVGAVEDGEIRGQPHRGAVLAQFQVRKGVKRAARHVLAAAVQQAGGALQHFLRGSAGEGEQEDSGRRDALRDQPGDAVRQGAGLPAARPGDDEQGPIGVRHGGALRVIEFFFPRKCRHEFSHVEA